MEEESVTADVMRAGAVLVDGGRSWYPGTPTKYYVLSDKAPTGAG